MGMFKIAVVMWLGFAGFAFAQMVEQGIIVTGEGRVAMAPDMAQVTLGVTHRAPTADGAMAQVSGGVAQIIAKLDEFGIAPKDRQTTGFYMRMVEDFRGSAEAGSPAKISFEAGNSVTITMRELDDLGKLIAAVTQEGANDFRGLNFGLQDDSAALGEARKRAVADAMLRAEQIAEAAGLKLGAVMRITENSQSGNSGVMMSRAAAMQEAAPIEGGEVGVNARVTMVFSIAPSI